MQRADRIQGARNGKTTSGSEVAPTGAADVAECIGRQNLGYRLGLIVTEQVRYFEVFVSVLAAVLTAAALGAFPVPGPTAVPTFTTG